MKTKCILILLAAVPCLMTLAGCAGVYTPYPLVRDHPDSQATKMPAGASNLPEGVWRDPRGNFEARVGKDGHAQLAWLVWNEKEKTYKCVTTEAFVTPREDLELSSRGFVSVRQLDKDGKPLDRYALLEYGHGAGTKLLIWLPRPSEFQDAIENGQLEGEAYPPECRHGAVLVTAPKGKLLLFLEDRDNTLVPGRYDSGPGGTLFDYANPLILEGISADEAKATTANVVAGGPETLKQPRPITKVTGIEVTGVGMFTIAQEETVTSEGPAGVSIVPAEKPTLQTQTTRIPATIGTTFGVSFIVRGSPPGDLTNLRIVWRFPDPGLKDPPKESPWYQDCDVGTCEIDKEQVAIYGLRYDWELVPGTWRLEIWKGERRLLTQSFELHRPESAPAHRACAAISSSRIRGPSPNPRLGPFRLIPLAGKSRTDGQARAIPQPRGKESSHETP